MRSQKTAHHDRFCCLLLIVCAGLFFTVPLLERPALCQSTRALHPVHSSQYPVFFDDADRGSLLRAARRQAAWVRGLPPESKFRLAGRSFSPAQLLTSLESFIEIAEQPANQQDMARRIRETFTVYQAAGLNSGIDIGRMLVTGYYEPLFEGSLQRDGPFRYPLYSPPAKLTGRTDHQTRKTPPGRLQDSSLQPFWTRAEIETGNLLAGHELLFLKDPIAAFLLHVQGSGKIRLRDGSTKAVCYAASNGHPYRSIGKVLVDEKKISREEATLPGIEAYLRSHPADMTRILHTNPRYIFFRWGDTNGPLGSNNIALTAGRSIAIDQQVLPAGTIGFLISKRPIFDKKGRLKGWLPLQRFVFPQDSGAAIQGAGRVDLFLGDSHEARRIAGLMREEGNLYFLLTK